MTLGQLQKHIESFPKGHQFDYALSDPFSWRGVYAEVAFTIWDKPSTREELLERIHEALTETFEGWKGGNYNYNVHTDIHFEEGEGRYTDGEYADEWIERLTGIEEPKTKEYKLISLLFKQ